MHLAQMVRMSRKKSSKRITFGAGGIRRQGDVGVGGGESYRERVELDDGESSGTGESGGTGISDSFSSKALCFFLISSARVKK